MAHLPKLTLPATTLRMRRHEGVEQVWDSVRGKWLVLTPEEWVRRHVVALFVERMGYAAGRVAEEVPVNMHGADQRADVVVYDGEGKPLIVCECKEPGVNIADDSVLDQAVRYNYILGASALFLTNGVQHLAFECQAGRYRTISPADFFDRYKVPNL